MPEADWREKDADMQACWTLIARRPLVLAVLVAINSASWNWSNATAADMVKVFRETAETLTDPGLGWMIVRRLPDDSPRFPYPYREEQLASYSVLTWR